MMKKKILTSVTGVATLSVLCVLALNVPAAQAASTLDLTGFEPEGADAALIDANAPAINVVGVDGVLISADGSSVSKPTSAANTRRDRAHANGLAAQLLVSNFANGDFNEPIAHALLTSATGRAPGVRGSGPTPSR